MPEIRQPLIPYPDEYSKKIREEEKQRELLRRQEEERKA